VVRRGVSAGGEDRQAGIPSRDRYADLARQRRARIVCRAGGAPPGSGAVAEPFLEQDTIRNSWLDAIDRFVGERLASLAG